MCRRRCFVALLWSVLYFSSSGVVSERAIPVLRRHVFLFLFLAVFVLLWGLRLFPVRGCAITSLFVVGGGGQVATMMGCVFFKEPSRIWKSLALCSARKAPRELPVFFANSHASFFFFSFLPFISFFFF